MLTESVELTGTPQQAWAVISDLDRWDELLPTVDEISRDGDGAIGVGTRFRVKQPGLARADYEVTAWEPGRSFTWQATALGVTTTATHVLTPVRDGTRLDLGIEWSGPAAVAVRLLLSRRAIDYLAREAAAFRAILATKRPS